MKTVEVKYKSGGCTIISNVMKELFANGAHYIMTVDTDLDVSTIRKLVDGFYVDSRNSQSWEIVAW